MTHPEQNLTTPERRPAVLDVTALQEWVASEGSPRLLDVRTPTEFATSHIPGSYNVPLDLLREHGREIRGHLNDDVVLICRSGARATQAETLLHAVGLPNVHILTGGVSAWDAVGAPLNRGAETWELERQVRLVAGGIVLAGVLASTVAPWAKWVSAGVGAGLTAAALTNSCVMGMLLSKLPLNRRANPDLRDILTHLNTDHVQR